MMEDLISDENITSGLSARKKIKPCMGFKFDEHDINCINRAIRKSVEFMEDFGKARDYNNFIDLTHYENNIIDDTEGTENI